MKIKCSPIKILQDEIYMYIKSAINWRKLCSNYFKIVYFKLFFKTIIVVIILHV